MRRFSIPPVLFVLGATLSSVGCSAAADPTPDEAITSTRQELSYDGVWQQSGFGPSKARVNASEASLGPENAATLTRAWNAPIRSYTTSAVAASGRVFVGGRNGNINAYDFATGALLWSVALPGSIGASPATAYGRVYVASNDRNLYALSSATGDILFSAKHSGQISRAAPLVADGKVFVYSETTGVVYAYDAKARGTIAPLFTLEPEGGASVEPSFAYGLVFVPAFDKRVHAYASATCTGRCVESWASPPLDGVMYVSPAVASNRLFGVSFGDEARMYALDAANGAVAWSHDLGGATAAVGPAVAYGKLFVSVVDRQEIWALGAASGALVWKAPLAGPPTDIPAVANRVVYVPSGLDSGQVEAFDTSCGSGGATCAPLVSLGVEGGVTSPVIASETLLVGAGKMMRAFRLP